VWSNTKDYSLMQDGRGYTSQAVRAGLWGDVQRSPQKCSQAFNSSQSRMSGVPAFFARDSRQVCAEMFDTNFLARAATPMAMRVKEPSRPNMVFASRVDRFAKPRPQWHAQPARATNDHRPSTRGLTPWPSNGGSRPSTVGQNISPRRSAARLRQPFADASQPFAPHSVRVERQLCNMCV